MPLNENKLEILEQTSLPRILVYLLKHSVSQTDLNNGIDASQGAKYKALDMLKEGDYITIIAPSGSLRRKDISLTEKGRHVAEALKRLNELL